MMCTTRQFQKRGGRCVRLHENNGDYRGLSSSGAPQERMGSTNDGVEVNDQHAPRVVKLALVEWATSLERTQKYGPRGEPAPFPASETAAYRRG